MPRTGSLDHTCSCSGIVLCDMMAARAARRRSLTFVPPNIEQPLEFLKAELGGCSHSV